MDAYLKQQDALLQDILSAKTDFKNQPDKLIPIYEKAFFAEPPLFNAQSHVVDLCKLYLKTGQNQKCWSFLNLLSLGKHGVPMEKIRYMQGMQLKKEGKHLDAIRSYMASYMYKLEYNQMPQGDKFAKDIKASVKALGWNEDTAGYLFSIVQHSTSEKELQSKYSSFLKEVQDGNS